MSVDQSTEDIHQAVGKNESGAAQGQVWSLIRMIAECRKVELIRLKCTLGERGPRWNPSVCYSGSVDEKRGCWQRAREKEGRKRGGAGLGLECSAQVFSPSGLSFRKGGHDKRGRLSCSSKKP